MTSVLNCVGLSSQTAASGLRAKALLACHAYMFSPERTPGQSMGIRSFVTCHEPPDALHAARPVLFIQLLKREWLSSCTTAAHFSAHD